MRAWVCLPVFLGMLKECTETKVSHVSLVAMWLTLSQMSRLLWRMICLPLVTGGNRCMNA